MATKNAPEKISDDLRPEYDLSKLTGGVRGKYYKRATAGTTLVLLEPDVAEAFPDGRTVNDILQAVAKVARRQSETTGRGCQGQSSRRAPRQSRVAFLRLAKKAALGAADRQSRSADARCDK